VEKGAGPVLGLAHCYNKLGGVASPDLSLAYCLNELGSGAGPRSSPHALL
jgi:hypothetical protein